MAMTIEYWTDPLCIWAFVAQPSLDRLVATFADQIAIRHRQRTSA